MCSILSSQGVAIATATAMVVSSTALFLAFSSKHNKINSTLLRPCLSSDDKKREKNMKKKKKVRFAEDVKEPKGNGEEYRKMHSEKMAMAQTTTSTNLCRNQIPANQLALYNGILKQQRSQTIVQCSF